MPISRPILALALTCYSVLIPLTQAQQTAVSRRPPSTYAESLAPHLTPLAEVIAISKKLKPDRDFGGAVILNEILHHVDDTGARLVVIHSVYRADSDSGAESLAHDTQTFRSATQKIHLALARTIAPDGTQTPVRSNATLIQSPQRGANQSLYSDAQELVIIFPKVKPGTLTESVTVLEEAQMRVPGEFMTSASWSSGWPQGRKRVVIDLPEELAARLRFSTLGTGAPKPQQAEAAAGRARFELRSDRSPGYHHEIGRPPVSQSGPATWITTFADWDAFADWYRPLLKDRGNLSPGLAAMVDAWTEGVEDEDKIIDRLLRRASNDIRYTGLEFGISSLQPYDCNEVWENQYGDCKDKANLLRAMLAHKGIKSYLTLLNTEHAGRIEKRSPDYRQFDHAILAIEREGGTLQFCDPTIEFARPGGLRPDDADRDVLVIRDDRAQFVRTPAASAGRLDYDFDLDLSPGREIAGWLTLTCNGNYASSYGSFFSKKDPQALNQALAGIITDFFPTAEVVDVERPRPDEWDGGDYQLRAYFVAPGSNDGSKLSLTFPQSDTLFPNLGETKYRISPYYGLADQVSIDATFRIPSSFGSPRLPSPLNVDSSAINGEASWETSPDDHQYRARLEILVKKPLLTAEEFQVAFAAVTSMKSWLAVPLIFDAGKASPPAAGDTPVAIDNFPLMPTAQGQLNLLDQRFPSDGNRAQRRAALLKVAQFFPNDLRAKFLVESNLAEIDWNEGENVAAIDRLLKLLNSPASDVVDDEEIAWAEYILAFCYRDDGNQEKAKEIFREIAENSDVSDFRRGWAGYQRLGILRREGKPDYRQLAQETHALIEFDTEARAFIVALHGEFMIRSGQIEGLRKRLNALVAESPNDLATIIELLCSVASELPADQSGQLAELIEKMPVGEDSPVVDLWKTEIEQLSRFRNASASYAAIQERLRTFVTENRPDHWQADSRQLEAIVEELDLLEDSAEPEAYIRVAASYLTKTPPGERFPFYLWRMAAWSEYAERSDQAVFKTPVLPLLLDLCDQLPKTDDYYLEGRFLRAKVLAQHEQFAEESAVLINLIESDLLSSDAFLIAASARLGTSLERQGDLHAARERYLTLDPYTDRYPSANDALLKAALISLELGERTPAIEILGRLAKTEDAILARTPHGRQIKSMCSLEDPESYWDTGAQWWPSWMTLHTQLLPGAVLLPARSPAIGDLQAFGTGLRNAVRAEDTSTFYDQLDLLLRALRWSPAYLNDCGSSITFLATTLNPESAAGLRDLMITICEHFRDPSDENRRNLQLYHALALVDSKRAAEALPISEKFFDAEVERDAIHYSMLRIRAIAASRVDGADLETPARGLEDVLARGENDDSRVQNVLQLAQLYSLLKRPDQEEILLARELEHPAIKSDELTAARLRSRYQSLARAGSGAKNFTSAVEAWLAAHAPAWLASCHPLGLDDPRVGDNLERSLDESSSRFSVEEVIKLNLLACRSDQISLREREAAFILAFGQLLFDASTHQQARAMITSVLEQEGFPKSLKQIALFSGLDDAVAFRRSADMAFLLSHPALDSENERLVELTDLYSKLAAMDFDSAGSVTGTIDQLASEGLSNAELSAVMQCFHRLLELGDLAAAETVYKSSGSWRLGPDVRPTNHVIKLSFLKLLKLARQTIPTTAKLHSELAPMLELDGVGEPAWFAQRRHLDETIDLSIADARALRLYQVKSKRFDQTNPRFWFDVADAIQSPASAEYAFKLLELYLRETKEDARRAGAAFLAPGIVDTDEPSIRERLGEIFAPFRDLANAPLTRDAIRLYEIQADSIRAGLPVDIDAQFANLTHPAARRIHTRAKLINLIQGEEKEKLRQYLNQMSADRLLDESLLDLTLPAFDLAGLSDEAELARETAAQKIPALISEGWRLPGSNSLSDAYRLAILLEQPQLVPATAIDDLIGGGLKNERRQLGLAMMRHRLDQDWPELETSAKEAIEKFPTFYSFYLEQARALYHQGRKQEAGEPLRIFLKFSADDVEFTKAKRWLEEVEKLETSGEGDDLHP